MQIKAASADDYISKLPADRREAITKLRQEVLKNLPKGFEEQINYGMLGYVVPHSIFPQGYHCDPRQPLPFANIASQKNHIAFYHMGLYGNAELLKWFLAEYPKHTKAKLDMGKSCVRFKKAEDIPYKLFGELMRKISVKDWIHFCVTTISDYKAGKAAAKKTGATSASPAAKKAAAKKVPAKKAAVKTVKKK
jgi:uncharacterized protein YdhG (YjbR/CyaY superfamily)